MLGYTNEAKKYMDEILITRGQSFSNNVVRILETLTRRRNYQITKKLLILIEETVKTYHKPHIEDYREIFRGLVASGTSRPLARTMARRAARMTSIGRQIEPTEYIHENMRIPLSEASRIHEMRIQPPIPPAPTPWWALPDDDPYEGEDVDDEINMESSEAHDAPWPSFEEVVETLTQNRNSTRRRRTGQQDD